MKKIFPMAALAVASMAYGALLVRYQIFPYRSLSLLYAKVKGNSTYQQQSNPTKADLDVADLLTVSPENLDSMRSQLCTIIFGTSVLPKQLPDTVFPIEDDAYSDLVNLQDIRQFRISQDHGINSIGYIFRPKRSSNRLMIYHQGHGGDFVLGKKTIEAFVERGFTVYALSMPLLGKNNQPTINLPKLGEVPLTTHERLAYLKSPIQYFIAPVICMINFSEHEHFLDITMVGLSGGGWTTTVAAAVDPRITNSFPVAGTYPMFIRFQRPEKNFGDFEQTYPPLVKHVNYLDMYVLGAAENGRMQVQILNKYDRCCFDGDDFKAYTDLIKSTVEEVGDGNFMVLSDNTHTEHQISEWAVAAMVKELNADQMNGERR